MRKATLIEVVSRKRKKEAIQQVQNGCRKKKKNISCFAPYKVQPVDQTSLIKIKQFQIRPDAMKKIKQDGSDKTKR
jgi:hypothetical protein